MRYVEPTKHMVKLVHSQGRRLAAILIYRYSGFEPVKDTTIVGYFVDVSTSLAHHFTLMYCFGGTYCTLLGICQVQTIKAVSAFWL